MAKQVGRAADDPLEEGDCLPRLIRIFERRLDADVGDPAGMYLVGFAVNAVRAYDLALEFLDTTVDARAHKVD